MKRLVSLFIILLTIQLSAIYHQTWSYEYESSIKNVNIVNGELIVGTTDGVFSQSFDEDSIDDPTLQSSEITGKQVVDGDFLYSLNARTISKYQISDDNSLSFVDQYEVPISVMDLLPKEIYVGFDHMVLTSSYEQYHHGIGDVTSYRIYVFDISDFSNPELKFEKFMDFDPFESLENIVLKEDGVIYHYSYYLGFLDYDNNSNAPNNISQVFQGSSCSDLLSEDYSIFDRDKLYKIINNEFELIYQFDFEIISAKINGTTLICKDTEDKYHYFNTEENELKNYYLNYGYYVKYYPYNDFLFLYYGSKLKCIKLDEDNSNYISSIDFNSDYSTTYNNCLFCREDETLKIFDTNNFEETYEIQIDYYDKFMINEEKLYTYNDNNAGYILMKTYDISDIGNPEVEYITHFTDLGNPILVKDDYLFFYNPLSFELSVVTIDDESNPVIESVLELDIYSYYGKTVYNDNFLYFISNDYCAKIDISEPQNASIVIEYDFLFTEASIYNIELHNDILFISDSFSDMYIVDFHDDSNPEILENYDLENSIKFSIENEKLVILDREQNSISFYDIDDDIPVKTGDFGFNLPINKVLGYQDGFIIDCGNHGIFLYDNNITPIDDVDNEIISNKIRSYPNPFSISASQRNAKSTIEFSLSKPEKVELSVYNLRGQKVKNLVNKSYDKGIHSISWDGTNKSSQKVASGIYFYRLTTKEQSIATKTIILK